MALSKDIYKKAQKFESEINSFTKKAKLYYDTARGLEDGGVKILNDFERINRILKINN